MNHYKDICECGKIIRQCRCPGGIIKIISPCPHKPKLFDQEKPYDNE